ncbi:MAG: hypothetical protein EOO77_06170 [Oxalobacteraceae bacterium]|nr:MAG: hypothetical protein EOO77_06170 [Oxalobacteraceae bacterium]
MGAGRGTPEQMLMAALVVLKDLEPFNVVRAREPIEWDTSMVGMDENPEMERINFANMPEYVIFASVAKKSAMKGLPKDVPRISWSIYTVDNEVVTGGGAENVEQAMRFGEIAYRVIYGLDYKGDN